MGLGGGGKRRRQTGRQTVAKKPVTSLSHTNERKNERTALRLLLPPYPLPPRPPEPFSDTCCYWHLRPSFPGEEARRRGNERWN